jgi:hypothetical protein
LESNGLQSEVAGQLTRIARRRLVWRAAQHRDPARAADEAMRWASVVSQACPANEAASQAITTLLDLIEERARERAEPGRDPVQVGRAARVREGAWLLARVCELAMEKTGISASR